MHEYMQTWEAMSKPPAHALKTIGAGRLKGKSDINPQWRYQALTENFGPCGVGWKFTIDRLWIEKGHGEEVFAFANISLYIKVDGKWSDAIPGNGGHKLVIQEREGVHNNDEAMKMAITDALGTAAKMLGVASAIYEGRWDGSKYRDFHDAQPVDRSPKNRPREQWGGAQPAEPPVEPPTTAAPKKWSAMNPDEKTEFALRRIHEIQSTMQGKEAMDALAKVAKAITPDVVGEDNYNKIDAAYTVAEQDLKNGSGQ